MSENDDEERRLLNIYTTQYNQIHTQIVQADRRINRLYDTLDEIRENINDLVSRRRQQPVSSAISGAAIASAAIPSISASEPAISASGPATNFRRAPNNNYRREYVHYDYANPINPNTYLEPIPAQPNRRAETNLTNLLSSFLTSTVSVRPSQEQINTATTLIRYSDIVEPIATNCAISLEPFLPTDMVRQINHCKHLFEPEQFNQWFQNNVRCPVCRHDIRTNTSENTSENNSSSSFQSTFTDLLFRSLLQPSTTRRNNNNDNDNDDILLFEAIITPNDT